MEELSHFHSFNSSAGLVCVVKHNLKSFANSDKRRVDTVQKSHSAEMENVTIVLSSRFKLVWCNIVTTRNKQSVNHLKVSTESVALRPTIRPTMTAGRVILHAIRNEIADNSIAPLLVEMQEKLRLAAKYELA